MSSAADICRILAISKATVSSHYLSAVRRVAILASELPSERNCPVHGYFRDTGELNHLAPKLRMDPRDIRFPFGHSRPCQLYSLVGMCILEDFGPSPHGRGLFLSA